MKKVVCMCVLVVMILAGGSYADSTNWTIGFFAGSNANNYGNRAYAGVSPGAGDIYVMGEDVITDPNPDTWAFVYFDDLVPLPGQMVASDIKQPFTSGSKHWSMSVGAGSQYSQTSCRLKLWSMNLADTSDGFNISLRVKNGIAGSNFTTGMILIPQWDKSISGSQTTPAYWFDLYPLVSQFRVGQTLQLELTASYSAVPEPSSAAALSTSLLALLGYAFNIRRRK